MSAVVLVIIAGGTLTALTATKEAGAQERFRSQAAAIAQEDQARLRAMRISDLSNSFTESRPITQNGNQYTVTSTATYVTDSGGATTSCTENTTNTEYVKATSSVTWPSIGGRPAVVINSLIAVPTGATAVNKGALQVAITDRNGAPRTNVPVTASGPTNLSGTTGTNGCVIWSNIPIGTYTVTPVLAGAVDANGVAPGAQTADVLSQSTKTVALQYDSPGRIAAQFQFRPYNGVGTTTAGQAVGVGVSQTGMTIDRFGGSGALATTQTTAMTLFPFTSPYAVYAGTCTANKPPAPSTGLQAATVTPGGTTNLNTTGTAGNQKVQLFPLYLTAFNGTSSTSPGTKASNATVVIKDLDCPKTYNFTTNSAGQLALPGLPYSDYSVCVRNSAGNRRYQNASIAVNSINGTTLNVYMGSATSTTSVCPP